MISSPVDAKAVRSSVIEAQTGPVSGRRLRPARRGPDLGVRHLRRRPGRAGSRRRAAEGHGDKARGGQVVMMNGSVTDPTRAGSSGERCPSSTARSDRQVVRTRRTGSSRTPSPTCPAPTPRWARTASTAWWPATTTSPPCHFRPQSRRVSPLPPVVRPGRRPAAVRRIVGGEQYLTVYKPFRSEAEQPLTWPSPGHAPEHRGHRRHHGRQTPPRRTSRLSCSPRSP